jgi:hypothetical protein
VSGARRARIGITTALGLASGSKPTVERKEDRYTPIR